MSSFVRSFADALPPRLRAGMGRRAAGLVVALLLEAILLLMLLALGRSMDANRKLDVPLTTIEITPEAEKAEEEPAKSKPEPEQPKERPAEEPPLEPAPPAPTPPAPAPSVIPMRSDQMVRADIAKIAPRPAQPSAAPRQSMGPADPGAPGDSQRVGTAPDGNPLYAAAWYREPYPDELRGYLSTADGPGWGLIACKTAPDYRVEGCVGLDEYPDGSKIERAVLAAAWQFKVRPPRVGGVYQVGAWVRIRIDYGMRPSSR